ncbi:MAG: 1,4-alpha-glucan branching protein domain-containing protein [Bacillota bacterium]
MSKGYLCIVLHAHLPYVHHPLESHLLEERWFFEALTETYLPLIKTFNNLISEGVNFKVTLSLSPTLISMLDSPLLQERYMAHLDKQRELADLEVERTKSQPDFNYVAKMYQEHLESAYNLYHVKYKANLIEAFKYLKDQGRIELITCAATHGFLPLLNIHRPSVEAQLRVGAELFAEKFGRYPRGMWLPECGYYYGLEDQLAKVGIEYFFVDTHGLIFASPRPKYGVLAPIRTNSGVYAFGRDTESSKQVWSSTEGYPGDFDYREYYRDIGYDLDYEYVKPYIHPDGIRINTGFKYYRITGKTDWKECYQPDWARQKAALHAGNFMFNRQHQINYYASCMDNPPIIISPYDAELFGHWWFEGPMWLEFLMKKIHYDQNVIETISPGDYLDRHHRIQQCTPCPSSWGNAGYNDVWLEGSNDWIYRLLHKASRQMIHVAGSMPHADGIYRRILNQAARELLLAQSSDWAFIMKTGTMVEYAKRRTSTHIERFNRLLHALKEGQIDKKWLQEIELEDNIFPSIDYKVYCS